MYECDECGKEFDYPPYDGYNGGCVCRDCENVGEDYDDYWDDEENEDEDY